MSSLDENTPLVHTTRVRVRCLIHLIAEAPQGSVTDLALPLSPRIDGREILEAYLGGHSQSRAIGRSRRMFVHPGASWVRNSK